MSITIGKHWKPGHTLFRDGAGKLWVLESYCMEPTVTLKQIYPGTERQMVTGGGVTGFMWKEFTEIKEDPPDE